MSTDTPHTVLRAQERVREVLVILLEGVSDLTLLEPSIARASKILETQQRLLQGVE
jgi:hypothetical protein